MKLKVYDKLGNPFVFLEPKDIILEFPYMGHNSLRKFLSKNQVRIIDAQQGKFEVELSDFDLKGMNDGENQSFVGTIIQGSKQYVLQFERALHVKNTDGVKSLKL